MTDVKIFVASRIDKQCKCIDCPIYIPVKCGAAYDTNYINDVIGDNTGENISHKRETYNELTVLYWAWKNQSADFLGICHYRRFLSFSDVSQSLEFSNTEHSAGCIVEKYIDDKLYDKYGLKDISLLEDLIKPISLQEYGLNSNYDAIKCAQKWHNIKDVDTLLEIIKEKYPEMYQLSRYYFFEYKYSFLYNCFIMRKEIFEKFCSWLFDILFELEKRIDMNYYSEQKARTPGTLAERLVGIWFLYLEQNDFRIKNMPLIYIEKPELGNYEIPPYFRKNFAAIACSCSNRYVPYLSVYLQSIKKCSNNNNNYDIIIFERNIQSQYKDILIKQFSTSNISIRFVNPLYYLQDYKLYFHNNYDLECYFRLVSPLMLRKYSKVLFTDIDLIFTRDPYDLYKIDIHSYPLAACQDLVWTAFLNNSGPDNWLEYAKVYLNLSNPYMYFNTGVIILNINYFNTNSLSSKLLEDISNKNYRILEQDAMNYFFKNNIFYIDTRWNFCPSNYIYDEFLAEMPLSCSKQYENDKMDPYVIHYAGTIKPWNNINSQEAHKWWRLAIQCPFFEKILFDAFKNDRANYKYTDQDFVYACTHYYQLLFKKFIYKVKYKVYSEDKSIHYKIKFQKLKKILKDVKEYKIKF